MPALRQRGGQNQYCGTCGLDLFEQPELPTHADWEAAQAAKQVASASSADTGPREPGRATAWFHGLSRQARITIAVVAAVLVVAVIVIATGGGKNESGSPDSSSEPSAAEECVDKWNSGATEDAKQVVGPLARNGQGDETPTYVTAGFSADVQDRCLILVAQPDLGAGIAFEYVETAEGTFDVPSGNSESIAALPNSVKQWNAHGDRQGNLVLGAP